MLKILSSLITIFFLCSCITINTYEKSSTPIPEKKQSNRTNFNEKKTSKLSNEAKHKLTKITKKAATHLANCLAKLIRVGQMSRKDAFDFKDKISYGLKVENTLLFATMTQDEQFCYKWVPIFSKKDSYVLDEELNKFWKRRKKNK